MMENENRTISFINEENEEVRFEVLEQTTLNGVNYLLVSEDTDDEDAVSLILKEVSEKNAEEAVYDIVDDDTEFTALAKVFEELLEDYEIEEE